MASSAKPSSVANSGASVGGKSIAANLLDVAIGRFQWPQGALLYFLPPERELLPDRAIRLSFQAYLKFSGLAYEDVCALNADYMSPSGQSPFLVLQFGTRPIIFSNFFQLVSFIEAQKLGLGQDLDKKEKSEHEAYISLIKMSLLSAMEYDAWISKASRQETLSSYSHGLPWPLKHLVPYSQYYKYRWNHWGLYKRDEASVLSEFNDACNALSVHLGGSRSFYQSGPTALDALMCGCVEAILNSSSQKLKSILSSYDNLVDFCHSSVLSQRKGLQFISSPSTANLSSNQ
ncbi:PREDICTED: metaxin-2-like [Amphimedon queenslandica]|uniref:Mitochondrial outer membrane transport complex Sam37/metaxin N-terminal domain-containing protein n=1 Tax=Amphimedon queenslandica TaxID=400682 RepID=A0A1X7UIH4_AMPQE|nr:PREDICTED: metaxin-2-like [Amphimedon queenslandica]|eukprot:XP_019854076.1 PREDICTED: metaxin-2-like [Amphimedon queenslandica]